MFEQIGEFKLIIKSQLVKLIRLGKHIQALQVRMYSNILRSSSAYIATASELKAKVKMWREAIKC